MNIVEQMAHDIEKSITGQLRNAFDDPDFEIDGATRSAIKRSVKKQQRRIQNEIQDDEIFLKNSLPGLIDLMECE